MFYNPDLLVKEKSKDLRQQKVSTPSLLESQSTPLPVYDVPSSKFIQQDLKSKTIRIPVEMHGTLKDLLEDNCNCEFKIDIAGGKAVTLKKIEATRLSNTSPFTFKIEAKGTGSEFYNTQKYYDYSTNSTGKATVSNCFTYVPAKTQQYQNINSPVIFTAYTPDVRKKIEKFKLIKNIKSEVSSYITKHGHLSNTFDKQGRPIPGRPKTPDQYIDQIIQYGNEINIKEVSDRHKSMVDKDTGKEVFTMSTKLDVKFFNFVNMTLADDKLLLSNNWKTSKKLEHETLPYKVLKDAITLSKEIKGAIGIVKQLKLNMIPVIKEGLNINTFVANRKERKPEYHSICLDLLVTYQE